MCAEIVEYVSKDEIANCNLASVNLGYFADEKTRSYDFEALGKTIKVLVNNLNNIIDKNYYELQESKKSNLSHRPIAIGVQGLADAFYKMKFPFESPEADTLNSRIFETMYYNALEKSNELAV